jgi:hypothetical protein
MIRLTSIIYFLIVAATLAVPLVLLWRLCFPVGEMRRIRRIWPVVVIAVAGAFLLFRPHQHVYQGLDSSAFRHMARAFEAGRPVHSEDTALAALPPEAREYVMMWPHSPERRTRERSFEVVSMHSCRTRPFFYPLLPLCMNGLDLLVPGNAMDYFVPLCGLALLLGWGMLLTHAMGGWAVPCLFGLWLGSPLPTWLFRGCYLESVSAALFGLFIALWCSRNTVRAVNGEQCISTGSDLLNKPLKRSALQELLFAAWSGWALGMAVSFHPVMILVAVPLIAFVFLDEYSRPWVRFAAVPAFAAGLLPIILQTLWVTAPYGAISISSIRGGYQISAAIRSVVFIGGRICSGTCCYLPCVDSFCPLAKDGGRFQCIDGGGHLHDAVVRLAGTACAVALE